MSRNGKYLHNIYCPAITNDVVPQILVALQNAGTIRQRYEASVPTSETDYLPSSHAALPTCRMYSKHGVDALQITLQRQNDGSIVQWEIHNGWYCWANENNLVTLIVFDDQERILHFRIVPKN